MNGIKSAYKFLINLLCILPLAAGELDVGAKSKKKSTDNIVDMVILILRISSKALFYLTIRRILVVVIDAIKIKV